MNINLPLPSPHKRLLRSGLIVGGGIIIVELLFNGGETAPIVVVVLMLISTFVFGVLWGQKAWKASGYAWITFPIILIVKYFLGMTGAHVSNPQLAVLLLSGLTLLVAAFGTAIGILFHKSLIQSGQK